MIGDQPLEVCPVYETCRAQVLEKIERIDKNVTSIHESVHGTENNPERGFVVRIDRLEQFRTVMLWVVCAISLSVITIVINGLAAAIGR